MPTPTFYAKKIAEELSKKGIKAKLEYFDGRKSVDIHIPEAKLDIEVDGSHHKTDSEQAMRDLLRAKFSLQEGRTTIRIPNTLAYNNPSKVADVIRDIIEHKEGNKITKQTTLGQTISKESKEELKTGIYNEVQWNQKYLDQKESKAGIYNEVQWNQKYPDYQDVVKSRARRKNRSWTSAERDDIEKRKQRTRERLHIELENAREEQRLRNIANLKKKKLEKKSSEKDKIPKAIVRKEEQKEEKPKKYWIFVLIAIIVLFGMALYSILNNAETLNKDEIDFMIASYAKYPQAPTTDEFARMNKIEEHAKAICKTHCSNQFVMGSSGLSMSGDELSMVCLCSDSNFSNINVNYYRINPKTGEVLVHNLWK